MGAQRFLSQAPGPDRERVDRSAQSPNKPEETDPFAHGDLEDPQVASRIEVPLPRRAIGDWIGNV